MTIAFVKKLKLDGTPCRKCAEVEDRLQAAGLMARIDQVIIADERAPDSEGMRLAAELDVDAAPFFVVTANGARTVYTSYLRLLREVLEAPASEAEEAREVLEQNPDLDFL